MIPCCLARDFYFHLEFGIRGVRRIDRVHRIFLIPIGKVREFLIRLRGMVRPNWDVKLVQWGNRHFKDAIGQSGDSSFMTVLPSACLGARGGGYARDDDDVGNILESIEDVLPFILKSTPRIPLSIRTLPIHRHRHRRNNKLPQHTPFLTVSRPLYQILQLAGAEHTLARAIDRKVTRPITSRVEVKETRVAIVHDKVIHVVVERGGVCGAVVRGECAGSVAVKGCVFPLVIVVCDVVVVVDVVPW